MTWMLTATGRKFTLGLVDPSAISTEDIAHHLAQINRYTGACCRPYSVAEHSLLVASIVSQRGVTDARVLMAALLHDAHEAYTTDLISPMKIMLGYAWDGVEARVEIAVRDRFGLLPTYAVHNGIVKHADLVALVTERGALMPPSDEVWHVERTHKPIGWYDFALMADRPWSGWRNTFHAAVDQLAAAIVSGARVPEGTRFHLTKAS